MKGSTIKISPEVLRFSWNNRRQKILVTNHNNFIITFEVSARSGPDGKALFAADRMNGDILPGRSEDITFEFKGTSRDNEAISNPILIVAKKMEGYKEVLEIPYQFRDENDDIYGDNLDDYPPCLNNSRFATNSKAKKTLSLMILILSLINFTYAVYISFFSPVDEIWAQTVVDHKLHDISMKCSSWLEAHRYIHNLTCKIH